MNLIKLPFRVGIGFDIHPTGEGESLVLGGYRFPAPYKLLGHSDADVLIHAVIDAMLGALALGNIGEFFPDHDPIFKGADSSLLLKKTLPLIQEKGYLPAQLDSILIAEQPRLMPHLIKIRESLAHLLEIPLENCSVKAKTHEKMDSTGQGLAVEARCVIVMYENPSSQKPK